MSAQTTPARRPISDNALAFRMAGRKANGQSEDQAVTVLRAELAASGHEFDEDKARNAFRATTVPQIPTGQRAAAGAAIEGRANQIFEDMVAREQARVRFAAHEAPPAADLDGEYLNRAQLAELPTPEWLIHGVLSRNAYAILRGRDGTYKTFVALDWALCLAAGKNWQDHTTGAARVLYVAGEGAHGITARVDAWESAWQRTIDPDRFVLRKSAVNLFKSGPAFDHLLNRITVGEFGLVVIDTLRRASGGADGNSSDMGVVVDNLERIKRAMSEVGGSVLVLSHTDKGDNDTRGFSGIEDDADVVWHTKRGEAANSLDLTNTKMKDAQDGAVFKLATVKSLESLVLERRSDVENADAVNESDTKVLGALRDTFGTTGATVAQLVEVTGLAAASVYTVRGRLERSGHITLTKRGNGHLIELAG